MKSKFLSLGFLLWMVSLQLGVFAQNDNDNDNQKSYEFKKSKTINRQYGVSNNDKLSIDNSFGKVEVHTWDKYEVKVDVSIAVSASTNDLAQKIFDGISIDDKQSGKDISFTTKINGANNSKGEKSTMRVDYSVYMPASNPLKIDNEFGPTIIPDYKGEVDLVSKFGSLTTGDLSDVEKIQVEFGKAHFGRINGGNLVIKYSKAEFSQLAGAIRMDLEFCSVIKVSLEENLTRMDLKASYSTVNLKPAAALGATYTILTSFGSLKNRTAIKFDGDDEDDDKGPKFDHKYTGRSGNGNVPIKVNSSFSNVIVGEPGADDIKEKSKNKIKS